MSFILQIVQESEQVQLTVTESTKTFSNQNRTTVINWIKKYFLKADYAFK